MNSWHNHLLKKYPHYHHWHSHPRHPFWHWVVFSFVTAFIFTYIYTNILDYRNEPTIQVTIPQAEAAGNTYYVSTLGNDANPGILSQPFKTIVKGNSILQPGDTLYIRGGTYDEPQNSAKAHSGTATAPITITSYPGETVVITGYPLYHYGFGTPGTSYIIFDGLIFDGSGDGDHNFYLGGGGNPPGPTHITVKNCELKNNLGMGLLGGSNPGVDSYFTISNCKIHHNGRQGSYYDNAVYFSPGSGITIEYSEFYANHGTQIQFYNPTGDSNNNIIRGNYIHDTSGDTYIGGASANPPDLGQLQGIVMGRGSNNQIYNNVIANMSVTRDRRGSDGDAAISLFGSGDNNVVYNNTVYNIVNADAIQIISAETNAKVRNNIIYQAPVGHELDNKSGSTTISNNLITNPSFVNASNNDYHLQSTSPAVNAGYTLGFPYNIDKDGVSRPQGSAYDIGAYEYGGVVSTPTPTPSPTPTPTLPAGCFVGSFSWQSQPITSQTGKFRAEFDAKPAAANIDGVIGLSQTISSAYTNLAAIVRFNNQGFIDARNGANYTAITSLPYTANTNYHFRLEIDLPSHTYSIYVTPQGGSEITLGTSYSFRTEQLSITSLNYWNVISNGGNTTICNFSISNVVASPTPTPSTSSGPSACDLNQDTKTDILDFQLLANVILGLSPNTGGYDINKDGQVNILDTQVLANVILGKTSCP